MAIHRTREAARRRVPKPIRSAVWRALTRFHRGKPGLLMHYEGLVPPGLPALPPGYQLRAWQPGDDEDWLRLLNDSGAFGRWDSARLASEMRGLLADAQFFAVREGKLVAATGVLERPLRGEPGLEIAWVVRHPAHRGLGLGRAVVASAVRGALGRASGRPVFLYTDDHRLTAIALYLDLGFLPDLHTHKGYPGRWDAVQRALAARRPPATASGQPPPD